VAAGRSVSESIFFDQCGICCIHAIVGRLLGRPADDAETLIRTMALSGQLLFFSMMRRTALTALNWDAFDAERLELINRIINEQTSTLLRSMKA
jgi:hypothetical protein